MAGGNLSDLISKRVPGIRPVDRSRTAGHQTLIEVQPPVDNQEYWPIQQRSWQSMGSGSCKENNTLSLRPRNYFVPSCRPIQKSG